MNICRNPHVIKSDPPRPNAARALAAYVTALESYQVRRTAKGRTALFRCYRRWILSFLDDESEADRAAVNFMVALRNQPPKSQEMGAAA